MIFPSLPSARASAALVLALTLTGCLSSHACAIVDDETVIEGHLDYAFNDGTQTTADFTPADTTTTTSAEGGTVVVRWSAPLSKTAAGVPVFLLSMSLPDGDGTFDLGTLSASTCACPSGFVTGSGAQASCGNGSAMTPPAAECQPASGTLKIRHLQLGDCAARRGCSDTTTVDLLLTSPAEKGLSGDFSFTHTSTSIKKSCPDFGLKIG